MKSRECARLCENLLHDHYIQVFPLKNSITHVATYCVINMESMCRSVWSSSRENTYLGNKQNSTATQYKDYANKKVEIQEKKQTEINKSEISWSNLYVRWPYRMCWIVGYVESCVMCISDGVKKKVYQIKLTANKNEFVYICAHIPIFRLCCANDDKRRARNGR